MGFEYLTNVPLQQARQDYLQMLIGQGFELVKCAHRLSDEGAEVATWYIIARKPHPSASA